MSGRSERAELERELLLSPAWETLEGLAGETGEAAVFLSQLGRALFPNGMPGSAAMTWPESGSFPVGPVAEPVVVDPQAELHAAVARFRALVEQIPAVTFMAVLGEGKNEIYVSPQIEALLGYTQAQWLEDPFLWYARLHPADREIWNDEFARGCRSGGPFCAECRFLALDGRVVWVRGEARVVRDEFGRPLFLQGVAFDITAAKRAQELLLREAVTSARQDEDLEIARRVQTGVLPKELSVPGLDIAASMLPAEHVGGDYYDVLACAGGCWFGIGDVSGHGLDAGIVMMMVQSALSALVASRPTSNPSQLVCALNRALYDNIRQRLGHDDHVTLTLLRYDYDGRLFYAGAHEDLLIFRHATGQVERVRTRGTWLGAIRDVSMITRDQALSLAPGDVLVLYTDGITEAMNARDEQFGLDRMSRAIAAAAPTSAQQVVDSVICAVKAFAAAQTDDITIVAIRPIPEPGRA